MIKRIGIFILLAVMLCVFTAGCDTVSKILSVAKDMQASGDSDENGGENEEENDSEQAEPPSEEEMDYDSGWWGTFVADGSNYSISDVTGYSFLFDFENMYTNEKTQGTAERKNNGAAYEDLVFLLDGDILTVSRTERQADGEIAEFSADYWRAYDYTEINPDLLLEDESMIQQEVAKELLTAALSGMLKEDMFLKQAGAVEIDGQPCWVFMVETGQSFTSGYAVSRLGTVFLRNDYLFKYIVQPYTKIESVDE